MATKTCPSCGEEVPVVAARCKSCFYDFNEEPETRKSGTMGLLVLFAAMALVGMGVFYYLHTQVAAERVVVEAETQTIIITRKSAAKTEATRIDFADVKRLEYVLGGETATYEIVAVTSFLSKSQTSESTVACVRQRMPRTVPLGRSGDQAGSSSITPGLE